MTSKTKVGKVGSKSKEDAPHELESQFVLRLPQMNYIEQRSTFHLPDGRHGIVRVDRVPLSLKTVDKKTFYKTADIGQEEPTGTTDPKSKKKDKDKDKKFVWNHGITLPLKNTRKRRFRKTAKKKYIGSPDVEKEVKRLLSTDAEAVSVRWEVIAEDEAKEPDNSLSLSNLESSPGTSGHKDHGSSVQHDELREIFNDISSSSEDEDEEGDRHEDDDLNIMDTEDYMVRQLHEKLNETDGSRDENDRNSQIVMEYQVQINNLKAKLQDTRNRKKEQEKLIMEVENQALRDRFLGLLNGMIHQEEQEMEQLASLQEQLDSLIEK
uniref:TAF7 RNA polymerase II, TATA box binding protein (TBP)-associated factor n=1 Tax=Sinocyclocheilus rhinocerous TaxID=307959 RepID=A0A673GUV6_9TELE